MPYPRRNFLRDIGNAGLVTVGGGIANLPPCTPLTAAETRVTPDVVRFSPEMEPLVRLIEKTERAKCFDMMVEQLRRGTSYRQFLAALFLAGVRDVSPKPPGFKYHCVFVIHAAHQLSLNAPIQDRLLPLFWALDYFKESQQQDIKEGDFQLQRVSGKLPSGPNAWNEFHAAMEAWDEPRADQAITALVRTRGAHEIVEQLWPYGAFDYRNIGHKAIFVANTWRTLQTIGWQHAEPALRSMVLGLLHYGKKERVNDYALDDQCFRQNRIRSREAAQKAAGALGRSRSETAQDLIAPLLEIIREGKTEDACDTTLKHLISGKAGTGELWDAVHLAAGEVMMRRPDVLGVHAVTCTNALHYGFSQAADRETRLFLLLQGVGWMCQFVNFFSKEPEYGADKITEIRESEIAAGPDAAVEEIFSSLSSARDAAAQETFAYAKKFPDPTVFQRTAEKLIIRKVEGAHDLKWTAAVFEDYNRVHPRWRPHMLATSVHFLRGHDAPDAKAYLRAKEALKSFQG